MTNTFETHSDNKKHLNERTMSNCFYQWTQPFDFQLLSKHFRWESRSRLHLTAHGDIADDTLAGSTASNDSVSIFCGPPSCKVVLRLTYSVALRSHGWTICAHGAWARAWGLDRRAVACRALVDPLIEVRPRAGHTPPKRYLLKAAGGEKDWFHLDWIKTIQVILVVLVKGENS